MGHNKPKLGDGKRLAEKREAPAIHPAGKEPEVPRGKLSQAGEGERPMYEPLPAGATGREKGRVLRKGGPKKESRVIETPCGKCLACRLGYHPGLCEGLPSSSSLNARRGKSGRRSASPLDPTETEIQTALINALELQRGRYPEIGLLFAIPNSGGLKGGFRTNARLVMKNRRMGVRKGVPDLMLPVPRGLFHGLFIEMKKPGGKPSPEQKVWLDQLSAQGYRTVVIFSVQSGIEVVLDYLDNTSSSSPNARPGQPGRARPGAGRRVEASKLCGHSRFSVCGCELRGNKKGAPK